MTNRDARKTIEPFEPLVGRSLPLIKTPELSTVRNTLVASLPHLREVVDALVTPLAARRSVFMPPTLLVGDPGCGKTTLAQLLMEKLGVPFAVFDAAGQADAMILGSSRKWHGAAPGLPLELIAQHEVGNVGVVIDELEKLGGSERNGDVRLMLLRAIRTEEVSSIPGSVPRGPAKPLGRELVGHGEFGERDSWTALESDESSDVSDAGRAARGCSRPSTSQIDHAVARPG